AGADTSNRTLTSAIELAFLSYLKSMTRQLLAFEQIKTLCEHTLGASILPEAVHELTGGTFNVTYSIALPERPVVLRVALAANADSSWDDEWLMQREY